MVVDVTQPGKPLFEGLIQVGAVVGFGAKDGDFHVVDRRFGFGFGAMGDWVRGGELSSGDLLRSHDAMIQYRDAVSRGCFAYGTM